MTDAEKLDQIHTFAKRNVNRITEAVNSIWKKYPGKPRDYNILSDSDKGMWDGLCWAGHEAARFENMIDYIRKQK